MMGSGTLTASFRSVNDTFELIVSDSGIGVPEYLGFRNPETLGFNLVLSWVSQLLGEITLDQTEGTQFRITFKR